MKTLDDLFEPVISDDGVEKYLHKQSGVVVFMSDLARKALTEDQILPFLLYQTVREKRMLGIE